MTTPDPAGAFEEARRLAVSADEAERERGIDRLLALSQPDIRRLALREVLGWLDPTRTAQDIVQIVSVKLLAKLRKGEVELINEKAFHWYLRKVVRNAARDASARRPDGPPPPGSEPASGATPSLSLREEERRRALEQLAEKAKRLLTTREWRVIHAFYFEGRPWRAIARDEHDGDQPPDEEALDRAEHTVRMRARRALDRLRGQLEDFAAFKEPEV